MPNSVLDAIKSGQWDFEPEDVTAEEYMATNSMPGTSDKLMTLAERAASGLPLWHPKDRTEYDSL